MSENKENEMKQLKQRLQRLSQRNEEWLKFERFINVEFGAIQEDLKKIATLLSKRKSNESE